MQKVPVLDPQGKPLMPTSPSRCRKWLRDGRAKVVHNDLNIFCIQLIAEPSGRKVQDVVVGIDPGKKFSGVGVVSAKATLFLAHLILPFPNITKKMTTRRILRRVRRGRRINKRDLRRSIPGGSFPEAWMRRGENLPPETPCRKVAFKLRAHRQKRFSNRRQGKLPPSIRANKQLELRVVKELMQVFPIAQIVYEVIKAKGSKGFSPAMVGQFKQLEWLSEFAPVATLEGWQTSILRRELRLAKNKEDKSAQTPESHANDGLSLAASHFMCYESFHTTNTRGHRWNGSIELTSAPFRVIARALIYRRQLHFENPVSDVPNHRKRKGGTITPFGLRSGDLVKAEKAGKTHIGWIGGYSEKNKVVSIYDINWKRIGQFTAKKVILLKRCTKLLVGSTNSVGNSSCA